ncbi:MAG: serine/threonine-protein kinase [bacterium]
MKFLTENQAFSGRYIIDRKLGAGGEGAVYLAYDQLLHRHVAIKCVHAGPQALSDSSGALNEAKRLASLQHPNIVTIFDFFPDEKNVFVVMEFINGQSLAQLEEPMDVRVFWDLARQCLEALGAAHALGMAHRDIKSANIMVTPTESGGIRVKLLDFGLAKVLTAPLEQTLDHSGALTGSIYYLSPEQLSRQLIDHRADLYSLGCAFYRALTLKTPFQGRDFPEIITAHLQHNFLPLAEYRPDLPPGLAAWVERLFSFDPNERPHSALAALEELERVKTSRAGLVRPLSAAAPTQPSPPSKPTRRFAVVLAATLGIICLGTAFTALTLWDAHEKKKASEQQPGEERTSFNSDERAAIAQREGKTATVTGEIGQFHEEGAVRFLLFKNAEPGDVALCFKNSDKGDFSSLLLKTFVDAKVTATGVVSKEGGKLLLQVPNMSQLRKQVLAGTKSQSP